MTRQSRSIQIFFLIVAVFQLVACKIDSQELLVRAAKEGQIEAVKGPLSRGANPDHRKGGWTLLMFVARESHIDIAKVLMEYGADVNARGTEGGRSGGGMALSIASEHGHIDMVKLLLAHGAEVNAKNKHGSSALMYAAEFGHPKIVKLLLNVSADNL